MPGFKGCFIFTWLAKIKGDSSMGRAGLSRTTLIVVVIVAVLGAAFLVGRMALAPALIGAVAHRQGAAGVGSAAARTPGAPLRSLAEIEAFLDAYRAKIVEDDFQLDAEALERMHEVLCNPSFASAWERVLGLFCMNGQSDIASDYVLDFIAGAPLPEPDSKVDSLFDRRWAIKTLGLTGGKRAEAFLLRVYETPVHQGLAGEKDELDARVHDRLTGPPPPAYGRSLILKGKTMFALCLLDAEKFSPMIEEDYRGVKEALRAVLKQAKENGTPANSPDEQPLTALHGVYVDALALRDVIREHGAASVYFMAPYDLTRLMAPRTSDCGDWIYE